jgi:hypothetical protein
LAILEDTAFALAGLGGVNAHGAGFVKAARDCGVKPALITVTSGQIVVLADWLQHKDLKKELIDPALEHNIIAQLAVAFTGDPGVFQPAFLQAIQRWWTPSPKSEKPLASVQLNNATTLGDLVAPPGNRLKHCKGTSLASIRSE